METFNLVTVITNSFIAFMDSNFARMPTIQHGEDSSPIDSSVVAVSVGDSVVIHAPVTRYDDGAILVSGENGVAAASFFVPVDDDLGDTWTEPEFDDASWIEGPLGVGFGEGNGFPNHYWSTIRPADVHPNATNVLIRVPFQLDELPDADQLVLRMKYDDGFVVHLNGERVLEHNLREPASWDSRARSHRNAEAVRFEYFILTDHIDKLRAGENLLAIRGINSSATSSDLLFQPELVLRNLVTGQNPHAIIYYTVDGTDPRAPNGEPTEGASVAEIGVPITIENGQQIVARNFDESGRGNQASIVLTDWSAPLQLRVVSKEICEAHDVSTDALSIPLGVAAVRDIQGDLQDDIVSTEGNWYGFDSRLETFDRIGKTNLGVLESIHWSDLNGDGRTDALAITDGLAESDSISWSELLDDERSFGAAHLVTNDDGRFQSIATLDIDADGDDDIVADSQVSGVVWFENRNGTGDFSSMKSLDIDPRFSFEASADVDGDGLRDLVVSADQHELHWLRNTGQDDGFTAPSPVSRAIDPTSLLIANLDDSQSSHLLVRSSDENSIFILQQDGRGFAMNTLSSVATRSFTVMDVDGDQDLDVVSDSDGTIQWYANLDSGNAFSSARTLATGIHADAIFSGDLNGDGRAELLASSDVFGVAMLKLQCRRPVIGDSNNDGIFNSSDLTYVFQAGEYEDEIDGNSDFEDGDWNGDGDFDSSDFVFAFKNGDYSSAAKR